jgi:zinc/manganese transport system substrate-binding protein
MKRTAKIVLVAVLIAMTVGSAYAVDRFVLNPSQVAGPPTCSAGALPYTTNQAPTTRQSATQPPTQNPPQLPLQVVAAENFWGSLVSQLGGNRTSVTSIVTDPNTDPHEYQSSAANAVAMANANYVIVNGAGYDSWADNLLNANPSSSRVVLNVAHLLGKQEGDNPHFWYGPGYVNATVHQMYLDLVSLDSAGANYYLLQYTQLNASLGEYNSRINEIAHQYGGIPVASTESIFQYLSEAANLSLISPYPFMKAVAEGNEPSPGCIAVFQSQLLSPSSPGNATVLVYNVQTVTPLTQQMTSLAASHGIPVVRVSETIQPPDTNFETWMNSQLLQLQNALNAVPLGQ